MARARVSSRRWADTRPPPIPGLLPIFQRYHGLCVHKNRQTQQCAHCGGGKSRIVITVLAKKPGHTPYLRSIVIGGRRPDHQISISLTLHRSPSNEITFRMYVILIVWLSQRTPNGRYRRFPPRPTGPDPASHTPRPVIIVAPGPVSFSSVTHWQDGNRPSGARLHAFVYCGACNDPFCRFLGSIPKCRYEAPEIEIPPLKRLATATNVYFQTT